MMQKNTRSGTKNKNLLSNLGSRMKKRGASRSGGASRPGSASKSSGASKTRGASGANSKTSQAAKNRSAKTSPPKRTAGGSKPRPNGRFVGIRSLAAKLSGGKKTSSQKRTSAKPSSRSARTTPNSRPEDVSNRAPARPAMSLDRKLDILGVLLTLVGFLTLLSLLSATNSFITGGWVAMIGAIFGLGMYFFPFCLIVVGLWLVLRNFEHIPHLALEQMVGMALLFLGGLAALHFTSAQVAQKDAFSLAGAAKGGGYIGAGLAEALKAALGSGGAVIALVAWNLIALSLSLDLSVLEMLQWFPNRMLRLQERFQDRFGRKTPSSEQLMFGGSDYPELTPLPHLEGETADTPEGTGAASTVTANSITPAVNGVTPGVTPQPVWTLPVVADILEPGTEVQYDGALDEQRARLIEQTLLSFGAPANVIEINRGPTITQFGVEPDFVETRNGRMRVRVGKIAALADDLALALSARTIRIQAPVPGKGFVGLEVPNEQIAPVALRTVIESEAFKRMKSPLRFAMGQNVAGSTVVADLAAMPHLLVAGATGSGKSVFVNSLISCLLLHNTPENLRMIMVDPKRVELTGYNGIPHLMAPVVVDVEKVVAALQWVTREMDMRYHKLADIGARNIIDFNTRQAARGGAKLPYLVVIIDELADLMMLAPDDTERSITRLAQLARATGIHLVIATQRPSVDVVTGLIKANLPARVAFAVASGVDSRVILDQPGAERLLGRGDMLFQAPDAPAAARLQGVYVSDAEIQRLVSFWQGVAVGGTPTPAPSAAGGTVDAPLPNIPLKQLPMWDDMTPEEDRDPLLNEAIDLARRQGRASISMLQRRMRIGYTRSARLIETMEAQGIVGPPDANTGTREILDYGQAAPPVDD
jgi:DNA segregation ATPase FtsK/SpoIIIE, S-DNA-T family